MEGDSTVASAERSLAMEGSGKAQNCHSMSERSSKIPIKSKLTRQKKPTSHASAGMSSKSASSPERSLKSGSGKQSDPRQDQEKPPNRANGRVKPSSATSRDVADQRKGAGSECASVKENVPPSSVDEGRQMTNSTVNSALKKGSTKRFVVCLYVNIKWGGE